MATFIIYADPAAEEWISVLAQFKLDGHQHRFVKFEDEITIDEDVVIVYPINLNKKADDKKLEAKLDSLLEKHTVIDSTDFDAIKNKSKFLAQNKSVSLEVFFSDEYKLPESAPTASKYIDAKTGHIKENRYRGKLQEAAKLRNELFKKVASNPLHSNPALKTQLQYWDYFFQWYEHCEGSMVLSECIAAVSQKYENNTVKFQLIKKGTFCCRDSETYKLIKKLGQMHYEEESLLGESEGVELSSAATKRKTFY